MKVEGISRATNTQGDVVTTIHVTDDFNSYYRNAETGRSCEGKKVETIYAGTVDCSAVKVGMEIEVIYDKAVATAKGIYQPIKRIEILDT